MDIIFVLLPLALLLVLLAAGGYIWAVKKGQFDDLDTPQLRMLSDEIPSSTSKSSSLPHDEDHVS